MSTTFLSIKTLLNQAALVTPEQFDTWGKQWRTAVEGGSDDSLLTFFSREKGITEEQFLEQLAKTLDWPFINLQGVNVPSEVRSRISTKVAFQYNIIQVSEENGELLIAVSNPFVPGLINAAQYEAGGPVQFGLAPKVEIEKALKKYYGVGAETLD